MSFGEADPIWLKKGATLSDKSAREEFGLTQNEIIEAIKNRKIQYRENNIHGNTKDTGLRFRQLDTASFQCPACGADATCHLPTESSIGLISV